MECASMTVLENGAGIPLITRKTAQPLDISFRNLSYSVQNRNGKVEKCILNALNGRCRSGKLTVILGPSGAGKTSLLKVLSCSVSTGVAGEILLNGKQYSRKVFKKQSCFVPQEFALLPLLTTRETLMIAADFKLGNRVKIKTKAEMVNEILHVLGLFAVAESLVKHLSGGEKKRLLIAEELLSNPSIMFFDEPTSGLDSSSASEMLFYLKNLAQDNRTIVCVLHQPSSYMFKMFDDLYVLKSGEFIYGGPAMDMVSTFEKYGFVCPQYYNPAEFVFEVIKNHKKLTLEAACDHTSLTASAGEINHCIISVDSKLLDAEESGQQPDLSVTAQCGTLLKRAAICIKRDLFMTYCKLSMSIFVSSFMGVVWYDFGYDAEKALSNVILFFILIAATYCCNILVTVLSYPNEAATVRREHRNNRYSVLAYFCSKLIVDFPLQIIMSCLYVFPVYYLSGQPTEMERMLIVWVLNFLIVIIAQTHGLAFGTLFSPQISIVLLIVVAVLLAITSGFPVMVNFMPVYIQWFANINCVKLSLEGMLAAVYGFNRENLDCHEIYCYFKSPKKVLQQFHMTDQNMNQIFIGLVIWILFYQIMFFLAVKWKNRTSR